jgi:hypothetical protein
MPLNQVKVGILDDPQRSAVLALSALSSQRGTMQGPANRGIAEPRHRPECSWSAGPFEVTVSNSCGAHHPRVSNQETRAPAPPLSALPIRPIGASPRYRAFAPGVSSEFSPQHPLQPLVSKGRRTRQPPRREVWIRLCIVHVEEVCAEQRDEGRGKGTRHEPRSIGIDRSLTKFATGREEAVMGIGTILIIVLVLLLVGALPTWPHSSNWGYFPSGGLGLVLLILLVLVLTGRL